MWYRSRYGGILLLWLLGCWSPSLAQPDPDSLWTRCYGDAQQSETALRLRSCRDHGFLVSGSCNGTSDAWLLRLNATGDTLWTRTYGVPSSSDQLCDAIEAHDGGIVMVRWAGGNVAVLKTDPATQGDLLWTVDLGYQSAYYSGMITQTADSGYAVTGGCQFGGTYNVFLARISAGGELLWLQRYTLGGSWGYCVRELPDGNFVISGWTVNDGRDALLVCTDANGELQWSERYGVTSRDEAIDLQLTPAGNLLLAGYCSPGTPLRCAQVWEVDLYGELQWTWQSATTWSTQIVSLTRLDDQWVCGGSGTPGTTGEDVWMCGLSDAGELQWEWYAPLFGDDRIHSVAPSRYGAMWVGMQAPSGQWDVWLGEVGWPGEPWPSRLTLRAVGNDLILRWRPCADYPYYHVYGVHPISQSWNWLGTTTGGTFTITQPVEEWYNFVVTGSTESTAARSRP